MKSEKLHSILKKPLSEREEVIAGYIFGSFLQCEIYEDIDIGILLIESFKPHHLYEIKIQKEIEEEIKKKFNEYVQIHITILNHQDLRFLYSILGNSRLIFCRDNIKRAKFESKIITRYLDLKPLYEYYDKMRKLRYANR